MKLPLLLTLSLLAVGCSNKPLSFASENTENTTETGLLRIENSQLDLSYAKPNIEWHRFNKLHIRSITADNLHPQDYKAPKIDKKWDGQRATYTVPEKGLRRLEQEFKSMADKIFDHEQPWQLSDVIDENTLVIDARITDIRLSAPIESTRRTFTSGGRTYTENAGSMVLIAILSDGRNNEVIAQSMDRGAAFDNWSTNSSVFNWGDVRTVYRSWGNALKNALFQVH